MDGGRREAHCLQRKARATTYPSARSPLFHSLSFFSSHPLAYSLSLSLLVAAAKAAAKDAEKARQKIIKEGGKKGVEIEVSGEWGLRS